MKKSIACVLAGALVTVMAAGCAAKKGPSDEALIQNTLDAWAEALASGDEARYMACYSKKYKTNDGKTIQEVMSRVPKATPDPELARGLDMGLAKARRTVKNGVCVVRIPNVEKSPPDYSDCFAITLSKERGRWLVTGIECRWWGGIGGSHY